jgi:hypothetical protein
MLTCWIVDRGAAEEASAKGFWEATQEEGLVTMEGSGRFMIERRLIPYRNESHDVFIHSGESYTSYKGWLVKN